MTTQDHPNHETASMRLDPHSLRRPKRAITGMSAILLPMQDETRIDWSGFQEHVQNTYDCGLIPAINMDTGYANLIDDATRQQALQLTQEIADGRTFLSGAFVGDRANDAFNLPAYRSAMDEIASHDGTPIIFQSYGLTQGTTTEIIERYHAISQACESFYAFELGTMFAPFGSVYSLTAYNALMQIPNCLGAKHSSLSRELEWQRLELRNQQRPDFLVLTGNDLAIDMVMYGSDYLLGLSTFSPEAFARRDRMWLEGDHHFYELNDLLQYLGAFAFRPTVPAYKHNAAMFLKLRGKIVCDATYPGADQRPASDREVLAAIADQLATFL